MACWFPYLHGLRSFGRSGADTATTVVVVVVVVVDVVQPVPDLHDPGTLLARRRSTTVSSVALQKDLLSKATHCRIQRVVLRRVPSLSNFFHFHAVIWKKLAN